MGNSGMSDQALQARHGAVAIKCNSGVIGSPLRQRTEAKRADHHNGNEQKQGGRKQKKPHSQITPLL